ncbi:MAG: ATP-binding protein [Geminicoccaceae bacterium]
MAGRLAIILAVLAAISGLVTYVIISRAPPYGPDARTVLFLLNLDLILLLLLVVVIIRRIVSLWGERRRGAAGAQLHARMALVFGLVAATPAVLVALFSLIFFNFGLEAWFSDRIRSALTNSMSVARSYLEEHREVIRGDALAMAADLNHETTTLFTDPARFQRFVEAQAALRSLTEAIVFNSGGEVLARTGLTFQIEPEAVSRNRLESAAGGEVVFLTSETDDRVRALVRLDGFLDAYLVVGRFVDPEVLNYVLETERVVGDYQRIERERSSIQITFTLIFSIVALLLLLIAVWVGMSFAGQIAAPISRLINAANRVRAGDLTARVPEENEAEEIGSLTRAFNRMTGQLQSQREELIAANQQLNERRRFTEAVLAGVTPGVIGLNAEGVIVLPNQAAATLLGEDVDALSGRPIADLMPEIEPLIERSRVAPRKPVREQVELVRGSVSRTLLVRVAAQRLRHEVSGFVLTFDDVTALLLAQREAAWAEVARRIAHEIKNPLTPIQLSAERLARRYPPAEPSDRERFETATNTIVQQVDIIRGLIDEFSSFAKSTGPKLGDHDIALLVRQAVDLQRAAHPNLTIEVAGGEKGTILRCDPQKVIQALTNLLQNAVDSVSASVPGPGGPDIEIVMKQSAHWLELAVTDRGRGWPSSDLAELRRPYVTFRKGGTGLGLAIVDKIMADHRGELLLESGDQGGAVARLRFPTSGGVEAQVA